MRLFCTDIDNTVLDEPGSERAFSDYWDGLKERGSSPVLVYNTGRAIEETQTLVESADLPEADFLICGVGTQIFDVSRGEVCTDWFEELSGEWDFERVKEVVSQYEGARPQPEECQNPFKSSWFWHDAHRASLESIMAELEQHGVMAQAVYSSKRDLDILPRAANKGNALRWLCRRLDVPLEEVVVAGDSGNDATMFEIPEVWGILVSNAEAALRKAARCRVHRSAQRSAKGVVEGLEHLERDEPGPRPLPGGDGGNESDNLYLVHISVHGLIRGRDLELGRDADTGGQCKYVLELVRALARHPRVGQVDLLTRQVADPKVSPDYARLYEELGHGAAIKRIPAGPRRYLRKEVLWRYLDIFVDQALALFRETGRLPDIIHAHYADAGYVGRQLATLLGCPLVFTGHSLGRTKLQRLLEGGGDPEKIERRYNLSTRIEAEELSLDAASLVCTSTRQEVEEQYSVYEYYTPERMRVIPPGIEIHRFAPPGELPVPEETARKVERFLDAPDRPLVMALARADEKKNLATLVRAFGESETLRDEANLLIVAGNRDTLAGLNPGARRVWSELLHLIDDYDLHGIAAVPKHHEAEEVPSFYRYAASKGGVFVNPALNEPFGLTLIEAASSGLPVLATSCGGPRDILENCRNGRLIDPLDREAMTEALEDALADRVRWEKWARAGLDGVHRHYTWKGHVERYLEETSELLADISQPHLITEKIRTALPLEDRIVFTGLENELLEGDAEAIAELRELMSENEPQLGFGIASGRSLGAVQELIEEHGLPRPDVYITDLGGEIHYGSRLVADESWARHLAFRWRPEAIREALAEVPGLWIQEEPGRQHRYKISYNYDPAQAPRRARIQRRLRELELPAKVLLSSNCFLDVVPLRSGKGQAIRYVAMRWGLRADKVLIYARRGSDYEALSGQYLAVLAADHAPELSHAGNLPRVYRAQSANFAGLVEGIRAYRFDSAIRVPQSAGGMELDVRHQDAVLSPDLTALDGDNE